MGKKITKFIKRANMWVHISITYKDGKMKQDMKWFRTKEEAEAFADSNNKHED